MGAGGVVAAGFRARSRAHMLGAVQLLSEGEYLSTFAGPMRLSPLSVETARACQNVLSRAISECGVQVHPSQLEPERVYVNGAGSYTHVLLTWGQHNVYVVIVLDDGGRVFGWHLLDLNRLYGLAPKE